jgi:ApaG protein
MGLLNQKKYNMTSQISEGVAISVETFYQASNSNVAQNIHLFAYRITIENHNDFPIKLHSRYWHIFDSNGEKREVEGEGVVGVKPVINPGKIYQYISGCNLNSEMGTMHGTYKFENLHNKSTFDAIIPLFEMVVPTKLN